MQRQVDESLIQPEQLGRLQFLVGSLGLSGADFIDLVDWAVCERLASEMAGVCAAEPALFVQPDALLRFRDKLEARTGRRWEPVAYKALFERVKADSAKHVRRPIDIADILLLRLSSPLACASCEARPPDVTLEIDHVVPVSKGGSSRRENLQFLCVACNRRKGNRREVGRWLNLA